jgi:hypothetical protein
MPRKPRPPEYFTIEALSTGQRSLSLQLDDDFADGVVIEPKLLQPLVNRPLLGAEEIIRRRRLSEAKTRQAQLLHSAKSLRKVLTNMLNPPEHKPFKRRF